MIPSSSDLPGSGANLGSPQAGDASVGANLGSLPTGFTVAAGFSSRVQATSTSGMPSMPDSPGINLGSPAQPADVSVVADNASNRLGFPSSSVVFPSSRVQPTKVCSKAALDVDSRMIASATTGKDPTAANLGFPSCQNSIPNPGGFPKLTTNFEQPAHKVTLTAGPNIAAQPQHDPQQQNSPAATPQPEATPLRRTSFADIAARKSSKPPDLFVHNFTAITPVMLNDGLTVIMPPSMYEQRLLKFQFALIGRLLLPQGTAPISTEDLKSELVSSFHTSGDWILLPLGKGFFSIQFRLKEDQLKAMRRISWRLSSGSFQLREWQPNFDPYKEISSTAQLWVRLFHLPVEYWHPEFLVGIFRSVGNVIKLDGNMAQGLVGHFARALVEVDLSKPLPESVRVGLQDNFFFVDFSYENVPLLCSFCHYIGHSVDNCRKAKAAPDENGNDEGGKKPKAPARNKKKWVEKEREKQQPNRFVPVGNVIEQIHSQQDKLMTSNAFDAPQTMHDAEGFVPKSAPYVNAGSQDQELHKDNGLHTFNSYEALQNMDSGDDFIPETQHDAGDILDKVTSSSGTISKELTKELLTAAREHSMNRQLRLERQGISAAAQNTTVAVSTDSESGEEMEKDLPPSTLPHQNATAAQNEAAGTAQEAADPNAADPNAAAVPRDLMTGEEGKKDTLVPAPAKSISKRTKNKRKIVESSTRQLRSSTKNKSISETTPEMIDAYIRSQYQPKAPQVASNPKLAQLEDQLRAAAALGRHTNAYILESGHKGALMSMDLVDNKQWGDIPHTEAYTDTDLHSD